MRTPVLLLAALTVAAPLAAQDGVIEINQARAEAGGVTAGDAAGFPVTIGTPNRSAQTFSWPMAAARNVSPAASITP